jgi:hypothetical protein
MFQSDRIHQQETKEEAHVPLIEEAYATVTISTPPVDDNLSESSSPHPTAKKIQDECSLITEGTSSSVVEYDSFYVHGMRLFDWLVEHTYHRVFSVINTILFLCAEEENAKNISCHQ